jgi:hypothetical protein
MRTLLILSLLAACPAFSADQDYNGRWDITTATGSRAWWRERTGVGTPNPAGKFVSAYGGDLNKIDTISQAGSSAAGKVEPTRAPQFVLRRAPHRRKAGGLRLHSQNPGIPSMATARTQQESRPLIGMG